MEVGMRRTPNPGFSFQACGWTSSKFWAGFLQNHCPGISLVPSSLASFPSSSPVFTPGTQQSRAACHCTLLGTQAACHPPDPGKAVAPRHLFWAYFLPQSWGHAGAQPGGGLRQCSHLAFGLRAASALAPDGGSTRGNWVQTSARAMGCCGSWMAPPMRYWGPASQCLCPGHPQVQPGVVLLTPTGRDGGPCSRLLMRKAEVQGT